VQKPNFFFLKNFKNWKFFMVIKKWAFFIFLLSTFILKRFVFYFLFFRIIEIRNIGWFWWLVWIKFFNSCRRVEKCRKSLFFFENCIFSIRLWQDSSFLEFLRGKNQGKSSKKIFLSCIVYKKFLSQNVEHTWQLNWKAFQKSKHLYFLPP